MYSATIDIRLVSDLGRQHNFLPGPTGAKVIAEKNSWSMGELVFVRSASYWKNDTDSWQSDEFIWPSVAIGDPFLRTQCP